jgi:hypothetical protein
MTFQEQIDNIMDTFDFNRVHQMMEAVGWGWGDPAVVPDTYAIKQDARKHLRSVAGSKREGWFAGCGGFTALNLHGQLNLWWGENSCVEQDGNFTEEADNE